jgi:predicted metal-binding protein
MEKYVTLAKELNMLNARLISPKEIVFDLRAILKCRWGCDNVFQQNMKCDTRNTTFQERVQMIKSYRSILLLHSHDPQELSRVVLEVERVAFLDGHYFAFAVRGCNLCKDCTLKIGEPCPTPNKIRPCDSSFGIDVYQTARNLGLPCQVLQNKNEVQNRYGFVLLD